MGLQEIKNRTRSREKSGVAFFIDATPIPPVGAIGPNGERQDIARQRGIGIHGGREGFSRRPMAASG